MTHNPRPTGALMRKLLVTLAVIAAAFGGGVAYAATVTGNGSTTYPSGLPPYWNLPSPSWCYEDTPCWIGSLADGRTDSQAYVAWQQVVKGTYGCPVLRSWGYVQTCVELYQP